MQLKGARVLLTGASGGLGRPLAQALAGAGATLLLAGRDGARLAALAGELAAPGTQTVSCDLRTARGVEAAATAARAFRTDVLVNNAGVLSFGLFETQPWAASEAVLDTDLVAPMRLVHALLPWLRALPRAAVVNVGSTYGSLPFPGFVAYSAAKAGLRAMSQALRRELADATVEVIHVAPRAIATPLNGAAVEALNRDLRSVSDKPEVVARQVVSAILRGRGERHLGFPERLFVWLNGCHPGLVDRALAGKLPVVRRHAAGKEPDAGDGGREQAPQRAPSGQAGIPAQARARRT